MIRTILAYLQEQNFIVRNNVRNQVYYTSPLHQGKANFSSNDEILQFKLDELQEIVNYATSEACYIHYLTSYLGDNTSDTPCGTCGYCSTTTFAPISASESLQQSVIQFFEKDFLPRIEKRDTTNVKHETGYSLAYHGNSHIGNLVGISKYKNGGPFADELLQRALQVIREKYPLNSIEIVVSIPPTKSGDLVEAFAKQLAHMLSITYILALSKKRETKAQKNLVNWVQKEQNVKDTFIVSSPQRIAGRTLLLVDDIYDSGYTLRAAAQALMQAGAFAIYPFTITRTLHSDDQ